MVAVSSDIENTVLPRVTGAAAGKNAGKLCPATSNQGIHNNRVTGETAFYPQDQGWNDGKQREEDKQANNTVYTFGNAEELNFF